MNDDDGMEWQPTTIRGGWRMEVTKDNSNNAMASEARE